ncbi:MAG TPA: NAD(P)(+) transhydrogenase (Re/Si-specific) subunit beta [Phycisphaerales bacterium]|nr:NAD(P)(+) transhydrogenase (Re/Si-specific) subunit beta [Phycisphaerales bacterium]HMP38442.1 NAD(P)(+) transhydrogenase (Re/Si-specific) subunit beta [Phycisphaerales bacterium]
MHLDENLRNLAYLLASVLFIFGIKGLTHPRTAVRGNTLGALGMAIAIAATLLDRGILGWGWIVTGLLLGSSAGAYLARRVQMTEMPEMVALLNGLGGGASMLVAGADLHERIHMTRAAAQAAAEGAATIPAPSIDAVTIGATAASCLVGAVTLAGSVMAFAKLREMAWVERIRLPAQQAVSATLFVIAAVLAALLVANPHAVWIYWLLALAAGALGILLVTPIGGADMPVVISLLNSYSGLAAAATGFVIGNNVLVIAGSLVGASGLILTRIMCRAMNRSLANVLFGGALAEQGGSRAAADEVYRTVKATSPAEVAMLLDGARRVLVVPGYGLAVSQAQHIVRDLANLLAQRGAEVDFGIHPVAGRMPGHMNVLLAEADVPYDRLKEMDEVNSTIEQCDVALVIGANDVVNPVARTDPASPIAGMPIIDVDRARTVVVVKRSLSPGFAGIPNPLFAAENCLMLFGDGKKALQELVAALKEGA